MEVNALPVNVLPLAENRIPANPKAKQGNDPAQVKKVAGEFEAMFVGMMLKSMRGTVGEDKLTGGGRGEETFRSLLDQEYANEAAKSGSIGLARMLEKEMTRTGGATPQPVREIKNAD